MRTIVLIAAAILPVICSCEQSKHLFEPYKTRSEALGGSGGSHSGSGTEFSAKDTTIWISGIDFPDGYDWRQDSLYGEVAARVVLLRGQEQVLDLPVGPAQHVSAQADMHHLVDGHLYTEYSDASGTYIKCDGKDLFTFADAECLRSILPFGGDIYTLTQKRSGNGFVLRRGSETLMERDDGVVQGTFGEGDQPQYGALYVNDGHICFSYTRRLGTQGSQKAFYLVSDGVEAQQYSDKGEIIAARQVDDDICLLTLNRSSGQLTQKYGKHEDVLKNQSVAGIKDIAIAPFNGKVFVSAAVLYGDGGDHCCVWVGGALQRVVFGRPMVIREQKDYCFLKTDGEDGLCLYDWLGDKTEEIGKYYLYNKNCGQLSGGRVFLAATSEESGLPVLWENGRTREIDLNGMLTGISVVVSEK